MNVELNVMKESKLAISGLTILGPMLVASLMLSLAHSTSSEAAQPPATPRKKVSRAAYRAELDRLMTENKVPCKFSLDCEALPLGIKACGGPAEYLIMSKGTRSKMQDALTDLTKTINEMDTVGNEGMMGTCEAIEKPSLACTKDTCVKSVINN